MNELKSLSLTILLLDPLLNDVCNLQVVQLEMPKVTVAMNTDIGKLDPVGLDTSLVQVVDDAVVVGGVDTGLTSRAEVGHLGDVGELAGGLGLHVASAESKSIVPNPLFGDLGIVRDGRIVGQRRIRQAPGTDRRTGVEGSAVVPERLSGVLQVDVTGHEIRTVVREQDRVLSTRRVRDEIGRAD